MEDPRVVVGTDENGNPKVYLHGDIDFRLAPLVVKAVEYAAQRPGTIVVLDLHALTFIDSSGISALVRAARWLRAHGRRLRLTRASRHVIQILRTAGFTRFFIFDCEEAWGTFPPGERLNDEKTWQHASFTIPARFSLISYVRTRISEMVRSVPGGEEHLDMLRLAVGEAASNAVRHGCCGDESLKVGVECSTDGETFLVEITDPGPGFDPDDVPTPLAGELREGGMGIHFMRLTMDDVDYRFDDRGTTVRLRKRLVSGDAADPPAAAREPAGVP